MPAVDALLEQKLGSLKLPLALTLPGGRRIGAADAAVTLRLNDLAPLASSSPARSARSAQDYVEGRVDFDGGMRDLMAIAAELIGDDPTRADDPAPLQLVAPRRRTARSRGAPRAALRRRAGPVPLRRLGRFLRALARLRSASTRAPTSATPSMTLDAGAGGQARPHLHEADAAARRALPRHRRRLGRPAAVGRRALRRARPRHHAEQEPARPRQPADRRARPRAAG